MRLVRIFIVLFAAIICIREISAAEIRPSVQLQLIKGEPIVSGMRWTITVSNTTPTAIKVSQFEVANVVRGTKFTDRSGADLRVVNETSIIDPPPPKVDLVSIKAGSSVKIEVGTKGLENVTENQLSLNRAVKIESPLRYNAEREIYIYRAGKKPIRSKCTAIGSVAVVVQP